MSASATCIYGIDYEFTNCQGLLYIGMINIIELISSSARVTSALSVTYRQGHLGPVKNGGKLLVEKLWWNFFWRKCVYLSFDGMLRCDNNNIRFPQLEVLNPAEEPS